MSTKITIFLWALLMIISGNSASAQVGATLEMTTRNFVGTPALGPAAGPIGPISLERDIANNNNFSTPSASQILTATMSLSSQTYTGLTYSNLSTGLVFGAQPTTAVSSNFPFTQEVDPLDTYNLLGSFNVAPGGPSNNMFTSSPNSAPTVQSGTGIIAGNFVPPANGSNGAVSVFTAAQVLFDQPGGPAVHNSTTRYYYGNLTISFNRFVTNPVIHIAGLGGSYRYVPAGNANPNDPASWLSTFFSTELEVQTVFPLTRMSGNQFFSVSGNNILNTAATPNGASVATNGLFNDLGAATGSFRINGTVSGVTLKVYLRGSNSSQFPWSTLGANVQGSNRNPLTGDIWWVSLSTGLEQLIPLPATGLRLNAALNGNDVVLNWKTLSESNSSHFEIERSTDGTNFGSVAAKAAAGSSYTESNYSIVDPGMSASIYYYRIKLVDIDNKYSYSNVAVVRKTGGIKGVRTFPNPATTQLNVEFSGAKGNYIVSLYNQAGQEVVSQKVNVNYSVQYVNISRSNLAGGSYILKVRKDDNTETYTEKVVVQ